MNTNRTLTLKYGSLVCVTAAAILSSFTPMTASASDVAANAASESAGGENTPAAASEDAGTGLQEIIVSAQRRSQSIQDVSISMDAYTDAQLKQLGMNNIQDLAQATPNVSFESFYNAGKPLISIRGLSIGALFTNFEQSPVGIYYDDVFIGSRSGQLAQMFDLERVEVLRGPQGTLFGRNTSAGAINFISKKPSDHLEVDGEVTYGRWNEFDFEGGATLPISDQLSLRVAGSRRERDGWEFNVSPTVAGKRLDNIDSWGARVLLEWKPTSDMTWLLNAHGNGSDSATPVNHADLGQTGQNIPNIYTGYQAPGAWNQVASNDPIYERLDAHGTSLTGTIHVGDLTLTSISAYERVAYNEAEDDDGSPYSIATFAVRDMLRQYSQELRLAAKQGPFDWVAGAFYYTDYLEQGLLETAFTDPFFFNTALGPAAEYLVNSPTQTSHNQAVFGDLHYALTDRWTLNVGARYTHESKHLRGEAFLNFPYFDTGLYQSIGGPGEPDSNLNRSWSAVTGRAGVEWRPVRDIMAYGSWSRGFKSGGFNGLAVNSVDELAPYNPETDDTFEIGLKTSWLNGHLTANTAVFYNKIKNLQTLYVPTINNIAFFFVRNAASGTSKGAEFEVHALEGGWNLSVGLGLLNTRYDRYVIPGGPDYTGEEFTNAPKASGNVMLQYSLSVPGGGTVSPVVDYSYQSLRWTDNPRRPGIDAIPGYGLLNVSIPWIDASERLRVSLWGRNMTNKHYFMNTIGNYSVNAGAADSYHAAPRTYGITVGYTYR
jgi:iron complex outermembrane recepter protein